MQLETHCLRGSIVLRPLGQAKAQASLVYATLSIVTER